MSASPQGFNTPRPRDTEVRRLEVDNEALRKALREVRPGLICRKHKQIVDRALAARR